MFGKKNAIILVQNSTAQKCQFDKNCVIQISQNGQFPGEMAKIGNSKFT